MSYIDVVVDGKFEEDKKDLSLKFRGSKNQRIIDVQKSLKTHQIIPYEV
jgi:anaerobic ribonucleoside-triphosphate reductase activating protein